MLAREEHQCFSSRPAAIPTARLAPEARPHNNTSHCVPTAAMAAFPLLLNTVTSDWETCLLDPRLVLAGTRLLALLPLALT